MTRTPCALLLALLMLSPCPMAADTQIRPDIPRSLAAFLDQQGIAVSRELWVRDWTDNMPDIPAHALYWVFDPATARSLTILLGGEGAWHVLNDPPDPAPLAHAVHLPDFENDRRVRRFLRQLATLLHDPRITICDPILAHQPDAVLATYTRPGGPGVNELRKVCAHRAHMERIFGHWRGRIFVLDYSGGIYEIIASGEIEGERLQGFHAREVHPPGSFVYVDEF